MQLVPPPSAGLWFADASGLRADS